jgi:hypothetical protein
VAATSPTGRVRRQDLAVVETRPCGYPISSSPSRPKETYMYIGIGTAIIIIILLIILL